MKQTKIVASISDRRCDVEFLRKLFFAGMNVVRMNTAHATPDGIRNIIKNVRTVSPHLALMIDTKGPALLGTAEAYRLTRKYPQYFEVMYGLMRDRNVRASAKSDYLQAVVRQADPRFVRSFGPQFDSTMNIALEVHPSDTALLQTAGLYYFTTGRTQKAESIYKNMMLQNPKSASAAAGYIQMLLTAQDWKQAVEVSDSVSAKFPAIPDFIEYSNIGRYNLKDYNGIISNCEKMLKVAPGDSAVALSAWSTMGDMHHQLGEQEKAYKAYDNALKVNPDYAPVLNNYAYFLSVQGKKLKKAYQMSKKTVEAEPDNATYLDTFGWILYLQGKALEAKPFFKHAMLYGGKESATMLEHIAHGEEARLIVLDDTAVGRDVDLAVAEGIECVHGLVGRGSGSQMDEDWT